MKSVIEFKQFLNKKKTPQEVAVSDYFSSP